MKNGICICATSARYSEGRNVTYDEYKHSIPFKVTVPSYSQIEFFSSVIHYMNSFKIQEDLSMQEVLGFRIHSASNPKLMRKEAIPYFLPLAMDKGESDFMLSPWAFDGNDSFGDSDDDSGGGGYDDIPDHSNKERDEEDDDEDEEIKKPVVTNKSNKKFSKKK